MGRDLGRGLLWMAAENCRSALNAMPSNTPVYSNRRKTYFAFRDDSIVSRTWIDVILNASMVIVITRCLCRVNSWGGGFRGRRLRFALLELSMLANPTAASTLCCFGYIVVTVQNHGPDERNNSLAVMMIYCSI